MVVETLAEVLAQRAPSPGRIPAAAGNDHLPADYHNRVEDALKRYGLSVSPGKLSFQEALSQGKRESFPAMDHDDGDRSAQAASGPEDDFKFSSLEYLGQAARTYLVFSAPDRIVVLDQHAAHERVLFEKFKKSRGGPVVSQQLLIPEVLTLSPKEAVLFEESVQLFKEVGIEAEAFGGDSVVIRSVPAILAHADLRTLIPDLLESFYDGDRLLGMQARQDKVIRLLACKAAVKANQAITTLETAALCRDLDETPFAATCPHGRPVYITLGLAELEKRFRRT
jgi:DNA mismatch repair protein MutL